MTTPYMARIEWLTARKSVIGGSDAAAIVGRHPYKTAEEVMEEKLSPVIEDKPNLACRHGTYCEPFVAELFTEETGLKVRRKNFMLHSESRPFMAANIDRKIQGMEAGLECKTTCVFNRAKFGDGNIVLAGSDDDPPFPYEYFVQITHYMAVTGWNRWFLAVLIGNKEFRWYEIERDERNIQYLIEEETKFYQQLQQERERRIINNG